MNDKTYIASARKKHQEIIIKMKMLNDRFIDELETTLQKENKAQSISMNVIIIAALALLVLVVLSVVFIGKTGKWGADVGDCAVNGGHCVENLQVCQDNYGSQSTINSAWNCEGEINGECCLPLGG